MDDEDVGEFGIAPQRIQTTEDFAPRDEKQSKPKRKLEQRQSSGPIPGVPVLELVLESCRDKAAVRLLKRMDTKYATKFLTKSKEKPKIIEKEQEQHEEHDSIDLEATTQDKIYKCDMGPIQRNNNENISSDDSDSDDSNLIFDEDEFDTIFKSMKIDRFGLNYRGLEKGNFFTIVGAEAPIRQNTKMSSFTMVDQHNKSVTIKGQAFGVGAFEEDDDDIYGRDDLTKYDFQLGNKTDKNINSLNAITSATQFIDGFEKTSKTSSQKSIKRIFKVQLPYLFEPRNWMKRKSRFGPEVIASTSNVVDASAGKIIGRHDLTPTQRGDILNEKSKENDPDEDIQPEVVTIENALIDKPKEEFKSISKSSFTSRKFIVPESIPNIFDRYLINALNYVTISLIPLFSYRFTSSNDSKTENAPVSTEKEEKTVKVLDKPKEIKTAIRNRFSWVPCQLLCYKMNIEAAIG